MVQYFFRTCRRSSHILSRHPAVLSCVCSCSLPPDTSSPEVWCGAYPVSESKAKKSFTSVIKIHSNGLELGRILDSMYAQSLCALSDALLAPHRFAVDQSKCCTPPKLCGVINNSKSWCFEKKEEKKKTFNVFL